MARPRRFWIALYAGVHDDPKLDALACELGTDRPKAFWHLTSLWLALMEHRQDESLNGLSSDVVEDWARWRGEWGLLWRALWKTNWLKYGDGGKEVASGWEDCNGASIRAAEAKRRFSESLTNRTRRKRDPQPVPVPPESSQTQTPVLEGAPVAPPILPLPPDPPGRAEFALTPTKAKAPSVAEAWASRFREFYDPYPRHVNPATAKRAWAKHCPKRIEQIDGKVVRIVALLEKHKAKLWINPELAKPYPERWLNAQEFPDETPSTPVPRDQASSGSLRPSGGGTDDQDARRRAGTGPGGGGRLPDATRRP